MDLDPELLERLAAAARRELAAAILIVASWAPLPLAGLALALRRPRAAAGLLVVAGLLVAQVPGPGPRLLGIATVLAAAVAAARSPA